MTGNTGGGSAREQLPWESPHSEAEGKAWAHPGMPLDTPGYRLSCQGRGRSLTRWPGGTQAATPTQHLSFPLEGLVLTGDSQPFQIHNSPFI